MGNASLGPLINDLTGNEKIVVDNSGGLGLEPPGTVSNYTTVNDLAQFSQPPAGTFMPPPTPIAPPNTPGNVWFSNSIWRAGIDPGPSNRFAIQSGAEPSVWYVNNTWYLMTASGSGQQLSQCPGNLDPTVYTNWFKKDGVTPGSTVVIGSGNAGYSQGAGYGAPAHSWVMIDPTDNYTLWCWFCNSSGAGGDSTILVAKSNINTPFVWTWESSIVCVTGPTAGSEGIDGNVSMAYDPVGKLWHMFLEVQYLNSAVPSPIHGGGTGTAYYYQIAHLTSPTPDGVFTILNGQNALASINVAGTVIGNMPYGPSQWGNKSGPWIGYEVGTSLWVLYWHGSTWGRSNFPSSIFRATNPNINTDTWTLCDQGYPCAIRSTVMEVDQTQDTFIAYGPGDVPYVFFTAGDNRHSSVITFISPLIPALHVCDGAGFWRKVQAGLDPNPPAYGNLPSVFWNIVYDAAFVPLGSGGFSAPLNTGTWALSYPSGATPVALSSNTSAALNDKITFDAVMTAPGTWELVMNCMTGPANGIVTMYLDNGAEASIGVPIGTMDTYSASNTYGVQFTISAITLGGFDTIRRRVWFQVTSKNAASSGYTFGWHGFALMRTDT